MITEEPPSMGCIEPTPIPAAISKLHQAIAAERLKTLRDELNKEAKFNRRYAIALLSLVLIAVPCVLFYWARYDPDIFERIVSGLLSSSAFTVILFVWLRSKRHIQELTIKIDEFKIQ